MKEVEFPHKFVSDNVSCCKKKKSVLSPTADDPVCYKWNTYIGIEGNKLLNAVKNISHRNWCI